MAVRICLTGTKNRPNTVGGRVTPKHSYTMKAKFVLKDDLGDILESIAESALKHSDEVNVHVKFSAYAGVQEMKVTTQQKYGMYEILDCSEYRIVDKLIDEYQIFDDTIGAGLKKLAEIKAKADQEDEETNNNE